MYGVPVASIGNAKAKGRLMAVPFPWLRDPPYAAA